MALALGVPWICKIRAAERLRRQPEFEQPAAAAKALPLASAVAAVANEDKGELS